MIAKMIEMFIWETLLGIFTGGASTAFSGIGSGASMIVPSIAHTGGMVVPGGIDTFHSGGLVGSRLSLASDEVLAKLQTGEVVLSRQQVQAAKQGGGRVTNHTPITVNATVNNDYDVQRLASTLALHMERYQQGAR